MSRSFKTLMAAGLALVGSFAVQPAPAEAQPYWGPHYRGGWGYRPYGYAPRAYFGPRYYGYRSVYYGPRRYGYPYRYYRRSNGGAFAAGLFGGLALGAIASAAANPYYAPAYYAPPRCFFERRRIVNPYGLVVVRRVRTCY
jgi:hypothetical protein